MKIDEHNGKFIEGIRTIKDTGFVNILILGPVGVGKSFIIKNIFPEFEVFEEAVFKQMIVSQKAGLAPIGINLSKDLISRDYPIEGLARFQDIIYDDIGVADCSPAYIEKTLYWLDKRKKPIGNKRKRTIFTTNLTLDELRSREGRVASRILEECHVFILDGPDRREQTTVYHK